MRRWIALILAALTAACFCGCSGKTDNDTSSDNSTSAVAKLDWWNDNEYFSAFAKYDGHGNEKQEKPDIDEATMSQSYTLYDVPKDDYISYWHKLEDSGLDLYDYNFGLLESQKIIDAAENGYAVFVNNKYMLELNYSIDLHELCFKLYVNHDGGE